MIHGGQKVTFGPWAASDTLSQDQPWQGGRGMYCRTGVMAPSSTATLQFSMDGGSTWFDCYDVNGVVMSLTAAGLRYYTAELPPGDYQVVLSGDPTNFTGYLIGI
jgi:hypothetical protein